MHHHNSINILTKALKFKSLDYIIFIIIRSNILSSISLTNTNTGEKNWNHGLNKLRERNYKNKTKNKQTRRMKKNGENQNIYRMIIINLVCENWINVFFSILERIKIEYMLV